MLQGGQHVSPLCTCFWASRARLKNIGKVSGVAHAPVVEEVQKLHPFCNCHFVE